MSRFVLIFILNMNNYLKLFIRGELAELIISMEPTQRFIFSKIQGEPKVVYFSMAIGKFNIEIVGFLGKVLLVHPI